MAEQGNCTAGRIGCIVAASLVIVCCLIGAVAYFVSGDSTVVNQEQGDNSSVIQKPLVFMYLELMQRV